MVVVSLCFERNRTGYTFILRDKSGRYDPYVLDYPCATLFYIQLLNTELFFGKSKGVSKSKKSKYSLK